MYTARIDWSEVGNQLFPKSYTIDTQPSVYTQTAMKSKQ